MAASFIAFFLGLSGWWVAAVVFGLSLAECALFFGFVFPAEIAAVMGGVLCSRGSVSLWQAIPAAVGGAIIGDSIGYALGERFGAPFLERKMGSRWAVVRSFLVRHGAMSVFFGRFSAFLRAAIPSAAGAAGIPYAKFLLWNVIGGAVWGAGFTLLGYAAGESYEILLDRAGVAGWIVLGIAVATVAGLLLRRRQRRRAAAVIPPSG